MAFWLPRDCTEGWAIPETTSPGFLEPFPWHGWDSGGAVTPAAKQTPTPLHGFGFMALNLGTCALAPLDHGCCCSNVTPKEANLMSQEQG